MNSSTPFESDQGSDTPVSPATVEAIQNHCVSFLGTVHTAIWFMDIEVGILFAKHHAFVSECKRNANAAPRRRLRPKWPDLPQNSSIRLQCSKWSIGIEDLLSVIRRERDYRVFDHRSFSRSGAMARPWLSRKSINPSNCRSARTEKPDKPRERSMWFSRYFSTH